MTLDELLLEWSFGEIEKLQISKKGPKDFVTNSDFKTEKITRLELLIRKIENNEELELDNGDTIIVANKEEALSTLRSGNIPRNGVPLEGTNGVKTTTSKLKKNVEFGTSKTAAGTTDAKAPVVDTDTKEALVIVMCNVLKEGGNLVPFDKEPYANNFKIINNSTNKFQDVGDREKVKIEELFNLVGGSTNPLAKLRAVLNNPYSIAVDILKSYPNPRFNRGDLFNNIRSTCSQITGLPADKWNPGDIYLVNSEPTLPTDKDSIVPWNELFVNNWGDTDAPLVSISLKEEKYQPGRAKSYLKKFGDKSKFNLPKETIDAMSDKDLQELD